MRIDNLIKRLEWAQSMGITHIDISKSDTGDFHMITGQNADGEVKQIYPMSDEEKAQQKASKPVSDKPKKETDFVGSDDWRYSDREDDFGDLEDGFFGDDNGKMYESIQKIKEQFKRYL